MRKNSNCGSSSIGSGGPVISTRPDIIEEVAVVQTAQGMLFGVMAGEGFYAPLETSLSDSSG